jgi:hypothetical protein
LALRRIATSTIVCQDFWQYITKKMDFLTDFQYSRIS